MNLSIAQAITHALRLLLWLLLFTVAGCALPQDQSPPAQAYLLEAGALTLPPARRSAKKILLVTVSKEAAGFDSNRIAYTKEPPKLDYYRDSVWGDTPSKMLLPILVRGFEQSGAFKAVVAPPSPVLADVRVDVDIVRLQQEFMTRPSQVRFIARIKIVNMRNGHVLQTRLFEAAVPAPSEDAAGAARAANGAVQKVLNEDRKSVV